VEVGRWPVRPRRTALRPEAATQERIDHFGGPVPAPREPSFPTGRLVKVESEHVAVPPALPPMAKPVVDRVPLEDPTRDASTAAVLRAPPPRRDTPVPFARRAVPEPFEHRGPPVVSPE
jgi:hypothetical protein